MLDQIIGMVAKQAGIPPQIATMAVPLVSKLLMQKASPTQASGLLSSLPSDITGMFSDADKKEFTSTQSNFSMDDIINKVDKEASINDKAKSKQAVDSIMGMLQKQGNTPDLSGNLFGQMGKKLDLNPFD
jgi:uncharacterized protein (DUF2267 family)